MAEGTHAVVEPKLKPRSVSSVPLGGPSVFILAALEQLISSKDAKGSRSAAKQLREAAEAARDLVKSVAGDASAEYDPRVIFEPLRLACDPGRNTTTHTVALDCVGKMVSYGFFSGASSSVGGQEGLSDTVVATICQLPPTSPSAVSLQQLKALLALVLAGLARQSSLLQAVRTAYDVFLLSKDPQTQAVAQGVLTQMCSSTFSRVKIREFASGAEGGAVSDAAGSANGSAQLAPKASEAESTEVTPDEGRVTLRDLETRASFDQEAPGLQSGSTSHGDGSNGTTGKSGAVDDATTSTQEKSSDLTEDELLTKDAFLVLRALCKLSWKPLGADSERDVRSHGMRSKLLALHLILGILQGHLRVFQDPSISLSSSTTGERTPLVQAVKQYLCLSLSRNAVSPVNQVFEVSCEIFWRVLDGLRTKLKVSQETS
jgi:brefeldin A-inhibited guanine nucleotide-exchange protein